ncbi:eukaryotic aspartyl protease domain-containing protein [Ditylenchus destructor]|uniref:Eukaryotic aspartyl protease domain-containing protein n=1 Tax=Ditylenchus destructor TaxID=166010 RepID=A0AAD4MKA2_9BILA|nr:eukaryotic aspartyl protease domain-containing protein [Ditylenchus destructor]
MATFRVYALLLISLTVAYGVVHKIPTRHHSLNSEQASGLFDLQSIRHQILRRGSFGIQASVGKLPLQDVYYLTTGNVTVGTPEQSFTVEVDAFSNNNLWLIGSNVNLKSANDNNPKKQPDNAKLIGPLSAPVKFVVLDELPYALDYFPIDGVLGLSPIQKNPANVSKVVDELVGQLDSPVISVYVNQTAAGNGTGQIPSSDINVFVNGTGAAYNKPTGLYAIDCNRTKAPVISLNIGGEGDYTDGTSQTLDLTGDDYIRYSESFKMCYLGVRFYNGNGYWYVGSEVLNNHCISYNLKENTVGFADSKVHMTTY